MEKVTMWVISLFFTLFTMAAGAQTADQLYQTADAALANTQNCDSALRTLQRMGASEKETGRYYEMMGRIYECKNNTEYAKVYYQYAQKKEPDNKQIEDKLLKLSGTLQNNSTQNDEIHRQQEKIDTRTASFTKHPNNCIYDFYHGMALGAGRMLGGKKAMAIQSLHFSVMLGWPVIGDKFTIEVTPTIGVLWGRNPRWYTTPAYLANPIPTGDGTGFQMTLEPFFNYLLINSRHHALACGMCMGGQIIANGAFVQRPSGEVSDNAQSYFIVGPGITYFGWSRLYLSASVMHTGLRSIHAALQTNGELRPVNLDYCRITIGVRFTGGA